MTIKKEVERVVFMRGPYRGQELSSVALCDTEYLKRALKRSGLDKKNKEPDKTSTGKDLTFCINHQPTSPATAIIRVHVCSATNPTVFPRKLKIAPKRIPSKAGNASTAFHASLLSASANLPNHFFKASSSFGVEPPVPPPPPKTPVMARTIVEIGSQY